MDRRRAAGDDRHIVGTGEARNDALGDCAEPRLHEASDVRYDSVLQCPIEIRRIAAIITNDDDRPVRPTISYAVEANFRTSGGCHSQPLRLRPEQGGVDPVICSPISWRLAAAARVFSRSCLGACRLGTVPCADVRGARSWRKHPLTARSSKHIGSRAAPAASG